MEQRLIDADALEQAVQGSIAEYGDAYTGEMIFGMRSVVYYATNDAPTVDVEPCWIPCSERLPEYYEPVITWDGHCYSVEKRIPYIRDEDGKPIKSEWWVSDDYDELEETDYYPNLRDGAAIAWMPLPKPYEVKE